MIQQAPNPFHRASRALACVIVLSLISLASPAGPTTAPGLTAPTASPQSWADDFPAFTTAHGDHHWIVGRSAKPCLSEAEALDQARQAAASQLRKLLRSTLPIAGPLRGESETWIRTRVDRELSFNNWIVDRSVSKTHRPYADIWSAAVLVDASPDRLSPVRRDYSDWRQARSATVRHTAGSLVGLCLAILAIYFVVNAATKGYFRTRLRCAAALTLILGTGCLIWLARAAG
jgi:hypothetical protein